MAEWNIQLGPKHVNATSYFIYPPSLRKAYFASRNNFRIVVIFSKIVSNNRKCEQRIGIYMENLLLPGKLDVREWGGWWT